MPVLAKPRLRGVAMMSVLSLTGCIDWEKHDSTPLSVRGSWCYLYSTKGDMSAFPELVIGARKISWFLVEDGRANPAMPKIDHTWVEADSKAPRMLFFQNGDLLPFELEIRPRDGIWGAPDLAEFRWHDESAVYVHLEKGTCRQLFDYFLEGD